MTNQTILFNARLILPDRVCLGSVVLEGNHIKQIDEGRSSMKEGIDCEGDIVMPGLIEMHTDNLEKYMVPRPGVYWPSSIASLIAHDNQIFNAGITTVLDAIAIGFSDDEEVRSKILNRSVEAVKHAQNEKLVRSDHFLHLRCELPSSTVFDSFCRFASEPLLKLVSVMDHTPGHRQWRDLVKWRTFHKDKKWTDEDAQAVIDHRASLRDKFAADNRRQIVEICEQKNIPTASHDDTIESHCLEAKNEGIRISEFPTTLVAAQKAKDLGMVTIMGAPNMVRRESHSGNISAQDLAENRLLDGFSSDFMPISLLHAAFELNRRIEVPLHQALSTVTSNIAEMVKLDDRGKLEKGKKADLLRVKVVEDLPIVTTIWKNGREMISHN